MPQNKFIIGTHMKHILVLLFISLFTINTHAQNALAKIEYAEAETAYQAGNYTESLAHLETVKKMLGSTNAKVMYLEILALKNHMANDFEEGITVEYYIISKRLFQLIKIYLKNFSDSVPIDKLKEIYDLEKNYKDYDIEIDKIIAGKQAFEDKDYDTAVKLYQEACEAQNPWACRIASNFDKLVKSTQEKQSVFEDIKNKMILVKGGSFTMGGKVSAYKKEYQPLPEHEVSVSDFYIGQYEVTFWEYFTIMKEKPKGISEAWHNALTKEKASKIPVSHLRESEILDFIKKLNDVTGMNYRLPTEAEWEYAAKGGNKSEGYKYSGSNNLKSVAYFNENSRRAVDNGIGNKESNELNLYDMSGNVAEMCSDFYSQTYYASSPQNNPTGPATGDSYVVRGGSVESEKSECLNIMRFWEEIDDKYMTNLGFRLVMDTN